MSSATAGSQAQPARPTGAEEAPSAANETPTAASESTNSYSARPANPGAYPGNRYIVCCDGTSNEPTGHSLNDTNSYRLAQICAPRTESTFQVVGYQQGIGTVQGKPSDNAAITTLGNLWAQGLGDGLDYNSFKVCQWLANKGCTANSDVVLCGFSRGSFTQRIVAQYINDVGLFEIYQGEPVEEYTQRFWVAYYSWFLSKASSAIPENLRQVAYAGLAKAKAQVPVHTQNYAPPFRPRSLSLALFDTVGTAGVPAEFGAQVDQLKDQVRAFQNRWQWLPEQLPPIVTWARHAVALGEHRALFPPTMMTDTGRCDLIQRWFPGAHTAVGGGDSGFQNGVASLDPLAWMIGELQDAGKVLFDTEKIQQMVPSVSTKQLISKVTALPSSSASLLWRALGTMNRTPGKTSNEQVQGPTDPFQQQMSRAGAQIDVPVPNTVKPGTNSQWQSYILSLGQQSTTAGAQIPAIARTAWIPAASTQLWLQEYQELTGIGDKGFHGFDSTSHPLNAQQGGSGAAQQPGPRFPSPSSSRPTRFFQ